jgi:hypothetical protein
MSKLTKIIEQQLSQESKIDPNYKPTPKFRPSSLGTPCMRKLYYSYLRVPEDFPAPLQLKKYAALGNMAHEMLSEYFRKAGVLIDYYKEDGSTPIDYWNPDKLDYEFPLKDPDLEMSAKIDAVLNLDGKLWLAEWKTATVKSFAKLSMPKPDHLVQGSTYLYTFNKALQEGKYKHIKELDGFGKAEGVIFLYLNKDDHSLKEYCLTEASSIFTQTINKIMVVKNNVVNDTLPSKTPDWCNSCAWRTKCVQNYKPSVE